MCLLMEINNTINEVFFTKLCNVIKNLNVIKAWDITLSLQEIEAGERC